LRRNGSEQGALAKDANISSALAGNRMTIPVDAVAVPVAPMEAKLVSALPAGPGWQFEPKWDGFRAIVARNGDATAIWSKSGKPLGRYFPELVEALLVTDTPSFVVDGEIIVPVGDVLSFSALQARLHPAASRVTKLSRETPAQLMMFDLLGHADEDIGDRPLGERRSLVEAFHDCDGSDRLRLSPATRAVKTAEKWLARAGCALDGVIAKPLNEPYRYGKRAMAKVKQRRTADCVVGGFRRTADGHGVASLLLGLYDDEGWLDHVGFVAGIGDADRLDWLPKLEKLIEPPGFTGKVPGGPSRWNRGEETPWFPLRPELVAEVTYDQVTDRRLRHAATFARWRPDKRPNQCNMEQLQPEISPAELLTILGRQR
jgi:ATP-dependent DNA ligase